MIHFYHKEYHNMEVIEQLRKDAIANGLCNLWQRKLSGNLDVQELVRLYIDGIDFCISHDYPSLDFLRKNFKKKSEKHGVYIDSEVKGLMNQNELVLNGDCKALLEYNGNAVARLWVRHGSVASINACGIANVSVDVYDDAKVYVAATKGAEISVYLHDKATAELVYGNIKVKRIK